MTEVKMAVNASLQWDFREIQQLVHNMSTDLHLAVPKLITTAWLPYRISQVGAVDYRPLCMKGSERNRWKPKQPQAVAAWQTQQVQQA